MTMPRHARRWLLFTYALAVAGTQWWDGGRRPAVAQTPETPPAAPRIANPHGPIQVACEVCHSAEAWTTVRQPLQFDHAVTGFPLIGAHERATCTRCHTSLVFSRVGTSCADCHRDVHEGRNGVRCQDCHVPNQWVTRADAIRDHATTSFPLEGRHALVECSRCHAGVGEASHTALSSECVACHADDYAATTRPEHAAAGYSTRCEECHDVATLAWTAGTFDHAARGFPLTGAHALVSCLECHVAGNFAAARADCNACHADAYAATTNPNHAQNAFPTGCSVCHGTVSWRATTFNHDVTGFPLRGAHAAVACGTCHTNGNYTNTAADCAACHQAAYDATTQPNHRAAGFSTDCVACHSTAAWQPARFDHDGLYFRIYSGKHRDKWASCNVCHVSPDNYVVFSCLECHEHDRTRMDDKHKEVGNYQYESSACYACHRNS
jgi:hypothetical protein